MGGNKGEAYQNALASRNGVVKNHAFVQFQVNRTNQFTHCQWVQSISGEKLCTIF